MFKSLLKVFLDQVFTYLFQHVFLFAHFFMFGRLFSYKIRCYKNYFFFFLLLTLLASCGGEKIAFEPTEDSKSCDADVAYMSEGKICARSGFGPAMEGKVEKLEQEYSKNNDIIGENGAKISVSTERRLIKTGYINFETTDIETSYAHLMQLIKKYSAYVGQEETNNSNRRIEIHLNIKIPKDNFDSFVHDLENAESNISRKNIEIEDVTEEFIDISARLAVKREAEQTYLRLLSNAKNVRDVLDIQDQIQAIRSEIEGIEGRLKYLEKSIAYSTLDVQLHQFVAKSDHLPTRVSFFRRAFASLKSGVNIFAEVIIAVLNAWVFVLIPLLIALCVRWILAKRRKNE